jgi:hypothetical protein
VGAMMAGDRAKWDINLIRHGLLTFASYRELGRGVVLNNGAGTGYARSSQLIVCVEL